MLSHKEPEPSVFHRISFGFTIAVVIIVVLPLILINFLVVPHLDGNQFIHHVTFSAEIAYVLFNYFKAMFTPPGFVPDGWVPDVEEDDNFEVKKKDGKSRRWCSKCDAHKPARAHHCRSCNKCVLLMDHHCVWVSNCVGLRNRKYFVLFLFGISVATVHFYSLLAVRVVSWVNETAENPQHPMSPIEAILSALIGFFMLPILAILIGFFGWHVYLLIQNQTSIENAEISDAEYSSVPAHQREEPLRNHSHRYDVGLKRNLTAILGPSVLQWMWPSEPPIDGLTYPINDEYRDRIRKRKAAYVLKRQQEAEEELFIQQHQQQQEEIVDPHSMPLPSPAAPSLPQSPSLSSQSKSIHSLQPINSHLHDEADEGSGSGSWKTASLSAPSASIMSSKRRQGPSAFSSYISDIRKPGHNSHSHKDFEMEPLMSIHDDEKDLQA